MMASEWLPIESAPKDGTEILVCGGTYSSDTWLCEIACPPLHGVWIAWWDGFYKEWSGVVETFYPKYWMPLPEPPKE